MIKTFTQRFCLFLLFAISLLHFNRSNAQAFSESFNDITTLSGSGWVLQNNSNPVGITNWFQGTNVAATGPFDAYNGAPNAYIGANFNNTTGGAGIISNWLMTPNRTFRNGDVFTFFTRKPATPGGGTDYPDRLEVRLSTNGASTNVGAPGNNVGNFTTLLLSINPTLVAGGYPYSWTQYTITISGLPAPTSGRIAFRYFVTSAGPLGTNSDYIGIDEVNYYPYICPALSVMPTSVPGGTTGAAYSSSLSQTGALGAPNFAITAGALPPGLTLAANGTISGTPTATGTFNFTVTVSDASGCSGSRAYSITVLCGANPISFTAPSLICASSPVALTATPAGGTFSGTGVSGSVFDPSAGSQIITYNYTDPYGCSFFANATFNVAEGGVTTITPTSQTICSGDAVTNIVTSNSLPGASYSWTRDNTAAVTGIAASGTTNTISGSLVNTTSTPQTVTFTTTASVNGCDNNQTSTVLVNPSPSVTAISGSSVCSGATLNVNPAGPVAGTTFNWTRNNTTAVTGVAASGSGLISGTLTNTTNAPVVVTFTITPSANGCTGTPATFDVTVNPTPSVSASVTSQSICSGASITPVAFTGTVAGAAYNWTRDNTGITGIAASGSGNITGSLVNTTSAPVTVTFTITPTANGCSGTAITSSVVVNPAVNAVASTTTQTTCSGAAITAINFSGNATGTIYNWTRDNTGITGIAASGSGNITGSLVNTTSAPVTVTFTITPTANGCSGTAITSSVVVNPAVNAVASTTTQTICSGAAITAINFSGNATGTVYNWTRDNTGITGIAASGSGNITGSLVNTTSAPVTVTFTITPTANGCAGTAITSSVVVNPAVNAVASATTQTICSGAAITAINFSGNATGTVYNWTRDNTSSVTGIAASGSGNITGSLVNATSAPVTVTFTVTPVANGCSGTAITSTVTVNPAIVATATPATQTVCSGAITPIILTSTATGTTYTWTRDNTTAATGIAASGTGNISGTLTNTTTNPVTVTFTITPSANGCAGTPITATVTVGAAPTIACPANIVLSNVTNTCGAPATYSATATGIPAPTISYAFTGATTGTGSGTGSGSTFNVGVTTVTLTATNSCGTTNCSFTVTVNDTQNPVITCLAPVTVSCAGNVPAPAPSTVTATDNCPGVVVTHVSDVISNQTCANRYTITRTYRATDAAGNNATCTQTITVNDQTAPVITCPANITVSSPVGSCNAVVNFTVNATDNCGGAVTITTLPASGSVFALGTTTVTATATDACGNSSTCSFTVTVNDGQLPVIATQPVNRSVCAGLDATFTVASSNVVSYQWQRFESGSWVNVSGATAASYTVTNTTTTQSGTRYRVRITGTCTTIFSNEVTLTVYALPQPVITTPTEICLQDRTVQLTATPSGGTFTGQGVTGTTWNLEIPGAGANTIQYSYTDGNGCTVATTKVFDLQTCNGRSSLLEIQAYPNPTQGQVTVKALVTIASNWTIDVTDITGRLVQRQQIPLRKGWNQFQVDLTGKVAGMYIISLGRGGGHKGEIKVLKQN